MFSKMSFRNRNGTTQLELLINAKRTQSPLTAGSHLKIRICFVRPGCTRSPEGKIWKVSWLFMSECQALRVFVLVETWIKVLSGAGSWLFNYPWIKDRLLHNISAINIWPSAPVFSVHLVCSGELSVSVENGTWSKLPCTGGNNLLPALCTLSFALFKKGIVWFMEPRPEY